MQNPPSLQLPSITSTQPSREKSIAFAIQVKNLLQKYNHPDEIPKQNKDIKIDLTIIEYIIKSLDSHIKINSDLNPNTFDNELILLLKEINEACHLLFVLDLSIWQNNNAFVCAYKTLFYSLSTEVKLHIGELYPVKKESQIKVYFNFTEEGQIEIIRSYPDYENVAIEGGGVKGNAHGGIVEALNELGVMATTRCVAGSSAGAISATLIALGYDGKAFKELIESINFKELQDITAPGDSVGKLFGAQVGLLVELFSGSMPSNFTAHGEEFINSGRALITRLRDFIKMGVSRIIERASPTQRSLMEFAGIISAWSHDRFTFANLADLALICPEENIKQLIVTGAEKITDSRTRMVLFSHLHSPRTEIALADRISAAIPKFFRSVFYNNKYYIDGGIEQNLPYSVFTESEFKLGGVSNNDIAKTIAFKFVKPAKNLYKSFFQPVEEKSPKLADKILLTPELVEHLTQNRQREANRLHTKAAPLVIPICNQGVNSTAFDLSHEMKETLYNGGYELTKQTLVLYMIPDRVLKSDIKYDEMEEAINTLSIDEINYLITRLNKDTDTVKNPSQKSSIFYDHWKPVNYLNINDIAEFKQALELKLQQLLATQQPPIPVEMQLRMNQEKIALRLQRLNDLFLHSGREIDLLKKIHIVLNMAIQNISLQSQSPEIIKILEELTGCPLTNIRNLTGNQIKILVLINISIPSQYNDKEYALLRAMNTLQESICETIKINLKFNHWFEVRNEIFYIEQQKDLQQWEIFVDKYNGFSLDLFRNIRVIQHIQSLHAYQDLLSWAIKYQDKGRGEALRLFLLAIYNGDLNWYRMLIKCVKNVIQSASQVQSKEMSYVVPHLFFNDKNTEDGRVNLQLLLIELANEMELLIKHHLFRHSDNQKLKQDIYNYEEILTDICNPDAQNYYMSPSMKRK